VFESRRGRHFNSIVRPFRFVTGPPTSRDSASSARLALGDSGLDMPDIRSAFRDAFAGAVSSVLSIAYCLSYAALIFSGPLAPWLSYGVAVAFLSSAVGAAAVALRSSFPFAIGGPDTSTSAVMATLIAVTAAQLAAAGNPHLLPATLIVMALATTLTGAVLSLLGFSRAGRAIRFVPYPVIGGFLAATGALMILGACQVITGHKVNWTDLAALAGHGGLAKIGAGVALAAVLELFLSRSRDVLIMPGVLLAAIVGTHLVLWLLHQPLATAQAAGWMFTPAPAAALHLPLAPAELAVFPWKMLPSLSGELFAVIFVTTITLLLNTSGIEIATKHEADIERELRAVGLANLLSGVLGGFVSCLALSRTTLARTAGAHGRLAGLTLAAISAALLVVDPAFLGYVPKFVLGGLLIFTGGRLMARWVITTARQLLPLEYVSLLVIALAILVFGYIAGMGIGIVIGCLTFAFSVSRVNAIKFSFDNTEYRSSLDRSPEELALLAAHGREIQGMTLQSYLFFGSANRLYVRVKQLLAEQPECCFLLFDFRLVTGLDSSAIYSFSQIRDAADEHGARIMLVNLTPELARVFHVARFVDGGVLVSATLDKALEHCEEQVIAAHKPAGSEARSLRAWLTQALNDPDLAERLADDCARREFAEGAVIARQGENATSMHFILEGRVGVILEQEDGRSLRVRSLGPQTTIGEMGLIAHKPRSGTIKAEAASILYELPLAAYERIRRENPALGQALLAYVTEVMAERLSFANRVIGVLQR
jgi:SulP family sulfate permease